MDPESLEEYQVTRPLIRSNRVFDDLSGIGGAILESLSIQHHLMGGMVERDDNAEQIVGIFKSRLRAIRRRKYCGVINTYGSLVIIIVTPFLIYMYML